METAYVTSKGRLTVPTMIRRRYGIKPGTKVCFIECENELLLQPVTKEYIRSLCGMLKSATSVTEALLKERARDKKRKDTKLKMRRGRARPGQNQRCLDAELTPS